MKGIFTKVVIAALVISAMPCEVKAGTKLNWGLGIAAACTLGGVLRLGYNAAQAQWKKQAEIDAQRAELDKLEDADGDLALFVDRTKMTNATTLLHDVESYNLLVANRQQKSEETQSTLDALATHIRNGAKAKNSELSQREKENTYASAFGKQCSEAKKQIKVGYNKYVLANLPTKEKTIFGLACVTIAGAFTGLGAFLHYYFGK